MVYLDDEEIKKLHNSSLLVEERKLLHILKLFKLNKPQEYDKFIKSLKDEEIDYIENLLHKREGYDTEISSTINKLNSIILQKIEKFLGIIDNELLKSFKIVVWES